MFFKILLVTSCVTIGLGAPDQQKSNQATYSQSFVREDVPLSYKYSAVHYYAPIRHSEPKEAKLTKHYNNPESKPLSHKHIQYAPIPNPREHIHETKPIIYTSVTPNPGTKYEQYDKAEKSAASAVNKDNLEPKPVPVDAKYIKPSTYKPHINHNVKIHQSPHHNFLTNYYENYHYPSTQMPVTTAVPNLKMDDIWKHFVYLQSQQPKQQTNYYNHDMSFLPKQDTPHEYGRYLSLQPVPRIAYLNNFNPVPEKLGTLHKHPNSYMRRLLWSPTKHREGKETAV